MIAVGTVAALGAAALYAVGIALQAAEARATPHRYALRISLLRRLAARPRWVAGTALGLAGWALQAFALTKAPLTLVQPLLGASLVFLLGIAVWRLGESPSPGSLIAVCAVAAGAPLLALTAPSRHAAHAGEPRLAIALGVLGAAAVAPLALRGAARAASIIVPVGAGLAYSWDSLATKFASDDYVAHAWLPLIWWFAAMNLAAGLGTLAEMSSLQRRPVAQTAPLVFALTALVPVALAPLLAGEVWPAGSLRDVGLVAALLLVCGGALVLARAPAVGRTLAADASSSASETPRSFRAASSAASVAAE